MCVYHTYWYWQISVGIILLGISVKAHIGASLHLTTPTAILTFSPICLSLCTHTHTHGRTHTQTVDSRVCLKSFGHMHCKQQTLDPFRMNRPPKLAHPTHHPILHNNHCTDNASTWLCNTCNLNFIGQVISRIYQYQYSPGR